MEKHPAQRATCEDASEAPPKPSIQRVMTDHGNKAQRLLRVDQIYSRKDRQVHFVKTAKSASKPDRFSKTAIVVRRIISKQGMVAETKVDIRSPALQLVFQELYEGVEGLELNRAPPVASLEVFFWARKALFEIKEKEKEKPTPDRSLIDDVGTALRLVAEDFPSQLASMESLLKQSEITYDLLWTIFPPKELVLAPKYGLMSQEQAFHVSRSGYRQRPDKTLFFGVDGHIITCDGRRLGRGEISIEIDQFEGARKITGLDVYPIGYHEGEAAIRETLIARGKKYLELLEGPVCREYLVTYAITEKILPNWERKSEMFNAIGRVIVDPEGYYLHNTSSELNFPIVYQGDRLGSESLLDEDFLTCASWVNGFSCTRKEWCQLAVAPLALVEWNHHAFKRIVMPEERRQLVHDLVKAHRQDKEAFDDIVENKGKGLVGLLTGSPGVGKTVTAEAVAEVTQRPLYVVASGELGVDPDQVDARLEQTLDITRRWGCVLLIDEADVFLAVRGKDLARDTLVSIFLRRLEYFRGVAILTTNRKEEIDPAFKSRIHFTLHYPELDHSSRKDVWRNFFNSIEKSSERPSFDDSVLGELAKHCLNGRQIKNVVSCAVSLSREKKTPVTVQGIQNLLDILVQDGEEVHPPSLLPRVNHRVVLLAALLLSWFVQWFLS